MSDSNVPFSEIVSDLRRLSESGATGAVFVVTSDNQGAQFFLEQGKFVYLYYANRMGLDALGEMAAIRSGRYRFRPGGVPLQRLQLPETGMILAALEGARDGASLGLSGGEPQSVATGATTLTQARKQVLQGCLAEFVGPIAAMLCEEHFASAPDLDSAIDALARELSSETQSQQFSAMARARLG